ncbi:hypothetical protein B0919_17295 [Hymenobacter sp. CRA2]|nr:hypothetical protein B0919_17295 [Hymenobacter sp. CRA2]
MAVAALWLPATAAGLTGALVPACTEASRPPAPPLPHSAQSYVRPYTAPFGYGCNLGYYGPAWPDEQLAAAARGAGVSTIRLTLPEQFLAQWGWGIRRGTFAYYADSLDLRELVCFVGEPSPAHRDPVTYPGSPEQSKLFANLYEPIWQPDGSVNPHNYYAQYLYQVLRRYGGRVRFWEVINEPDFITDRSNREWLARAPTPAETPNVRAPIYRYIRTLRITWEVVKKYQPDAYVTPGGLGYPEYLDALLRYSDNPRDGRVTSQYPATGGAYFDALDYHVYPAYDLRRREWRRAGQFAYSHHSDAAAAQVVAHKNAMEAVLHRYGYDGRTYPRKPAIVTETNLSRRPADWRYGSDELQRNFGMKALVLAQKSGIRQLHFYHLAETAPAPPAGSAVDGTTEFQLMGLYEQLPEATAGQPRLTPLGMGVRATAKLLGGLAYDAARTAGLQLPVSVEGAAFADARRVVYVLWARTAQDRSEQASAAYSFPAALKIGRVRQYAWDDEAAMQKPVIRTAQDILLTGTPAFFEPVPVGKPRVLMAKVHLWRR